MTQEELQAIRERCDKATPGPWDHKTRVNEEWCTESWIAPIQGIPWYRQNCTEQLLNNQEFIAHSRTDLPKALDEIERQAKEIERLQRALERIAYRESNTEQKWIDIVEDLQEIARQALEDDV